MWDREEHAVWRICLDGRVDEDWAEWFTWASVRCEPCTNGQWQTVAEGELRSRAALRRLVARMLDRHIQVASIDRTCDARQREDIYASAIESWR